VIREDLRRLSDALHRRVGMHIGIMEGGRALFRVRRVIGIDDDIGDDDVGRLAGSGANKLAALRAASLRNLSRARPALPLPFNCPRAADVHLINAKSLREITISRAGERLKRLNSLVALSRRFSSRGALMWELALGSPLPPQIRNRKITRGGEKHGVGVGGGEKSATPRMPRN
jgi:hypothetical protein